jgi:hypothetical protein
MTTTDWRIDVKIEEDESKTDATATLRLPSGNELSAAGHSRRNPADPAKPRIGEEIATARALSGLVHELLDKASGEIEDSTHKPAQLYV